jgi:drug/metabolite transporter (DMT)-like permease
LLKNNTENLPVSPPPTLALCALFLGGLAIGCGPIFVRLSETAPIATAFWRLLLAQPFLWAILAWSARSGKQPLWPTRRDAGRMALVGFLFTGDLAVWHWSIKLTSVANATLLGNFAPAFAALFAWLLWHEKIPRVLLMGMAIAFGGLVLLMYGRTAPTQTGGTAPALGNALGLLTAAFYASYMLSAKQVRTHYSSAALMAWSGVFCSVFLLICALLMGGAFFPATPHGWLVLLGLALLTHVVGQSLITYAIAHLSVTFSSVGLLIQPVVAAFFAWLLLGEAIGAPQIAGGAFVLIGIFVARKAP